MMEIARLPNVERRSRLAYGKCRRVAISRTSVTCFMYYLLRIVDFMQQSFCSDEFDEISTYNSDQDDDNSDRNDNDTSDRRQIRSFSQITCGLGG